MNSSIMHTGGAYKPIKVFCLFHKFRASDPLPSSVELADGVLLIKSRKDDCLYMTTSTDCFCQTRTYHSGLPCKHMKALLAGNSTEASRTQARAYQARKRDARRKAKAGMAQPVDSIRPDMSGFRPVLEVVA